MKDTCSSSTISSAGYPALMKATTKIEVAEEPEPLEPPDHSLLLTAPPPPSSGGVPVIDLSSSGSDSEAEIERRPRTSDSEGVPAKKRRLEGRMMVNLPPGFLDPLPSAEQLARPPPLALPEPVMARPPTLTQGSRQFWKAGDFEGLPVVDESPQFSRYKMRNIFGRTKKVSRRESSGSSSQIHTRHSESQAEDVPEEGAPDIHMEDPLQESSQEPPQQQQHSQDDGILLIDALGAFTRHRGRATCETIRDLPPGTRVIIEVNNEGIPCNYPESTLLASFLGVLVKDSILAPISFLDWRNPGMEQFKKRMIADVEAKFAYPLHIRTWILSSMGVKWRNYKTSLKAAYFDGRPLQEILEKVPAGIDPVQWATLVARWNEPRDKERAAKNTSNAQQQKCPHTMGRKTSVRRQQETSTQDRLQLWRLNRLHKDGSWTSEDARQKWELACQMLSASDLTPESGNIEQNERVFREVMGPEHPGRVRCKGFGVTPSKYYPQTSGSTGYSSTGGSGHVRTDERLARLESEVGEMKGMMTKMFEIMKKKESKGKKKAHTLIDDGPDEDEDEGDED